MNNEELRSVKVLRNTAWAMIGYVLYALVGFVSRSVFIAKLGQEIAGVSTLFGSILSLLSMAELGFGSAISIHLYKPVAEGDNPKIAALLSLYKKACRVIAVAIFLLALGLLPFIPYFVKSTQQISNLRWYFFLYTIQTVCSYSYAYKGVLLTVSQQGYIKSNITNFFLLTCSIAQICVLYWTGSFSLYLVAYILSTLLTNIFVSSAVNRKFPALNSLAGTPLEPEEKRNIFSFIRASAIDRVAVAVKSATDNMIVSGFISVLVTGIVGNYTMIINTVRTLVNFFFTSASDATGNLAASANKDVQYRTLLDMEFLALWLYGFISVGMLCTITPFVCNIWIRSASAALPFSTLLLLVLNFYLVGICWPAFSFFYAKGLLRKVPYMNILNVALNLVISLGLVSSLGVNGVYIGTVLSYLCSNFFLVHYMVLRHHFEGKIGLFLRLFLKYVVVTILAGVLCVWGCSCIPGESVIVRILLCTVAYNGVFLLCSWGSREFSSISQLVVTILKQVTSKN